MTFAAPFALLALIALPVIWWLLRLLPPRPQKQILPSTPLLKGIAKKQETPSTSPWWLTALRLALAAIAIFAIASPTWQPPAKTIANSDAPLLIILDNGWTTNPDWQSRITAATGLLEQATEQARPAALLVTATNATEKLQFQPANTVLEQLAAQSPQPFPEDRSNAAKRLPDTPAEIVWIASHLATTSDTDLTKAIENASQLTILQDPTAAITTIKSVATGASQTTVILEKLIPSNEPAPTLTARDDKGTAIATITAPFITGEKTTEAIIELPIELRNDIASLTLSGDKTAASTYLLDDSNRRRTIGLLTSDASDKAQPLLAPLFYIEKALSPFADLRKAPTSNLGEAIPELIQSGVSTLIMADIGTLPDESADALYDWVEQGGALISFAGRRFATSSADFSPVRLRQGERNLGGSLTWETPKKLAPFPETSPFAGIELPDDVEITRQVLAEPDATLIDKTWAELEDGTPLVTATQQGKGWLILFHVTADTKWSNLPLSGTFVEMLSKLTIFVAQPKINQADEQTTNTERPSLPPLKTLDAAGALTLPSSKAEPIRPATLAALNPSETAPPGLYGQAETVIAHNLLRDKTLLAPLNASNLLPSAQTQLIKQEQGTDLRPILFTLAAILLLIDSAIVAWLGGLFARVPKAATLALLCTLFIPQPSDAQEQSATEFALKATSATHLAYVTTGNAELDRTSAAGLTGLSRYIRFRTALEPGDPIGVDIDADDLAFFPLLYWPIEGTTQKPSPSAIARIDTYMKNGGTILFDTRDQLSSPVGGAPSPASLALRTIVENLNIPPLEPVPAGHALTKAFYLLSSFPGRWQGSPLWVEAATRNAGSASNQSDGVSPIMITANDMAGAWAVDDNNAYMFPTVPTDPQQRLYALRTGVNIVMYTLTGNYKTDQVHVPALLERLGQ